MRWREFGIVGIALALAVLIGEGLNSILRLDRPGTSITYGVMSRVFGRGGAEDLTGPDSPNVTDIDQIETLLPALAANAVGMGNSPFRELVRGEVSLKHFVDGCEELKPDQRKVMSFLRSELFNPFEPLNYFYDADRRLPDDVRRFLERYTFRKVWLTTNSAGERNTYPLVDSPAKILIAGDSLAMSPMVDDRETLASQLQAMDDDHQYISIGVPGTHAQNIICVLERALKRYGGQVREVIYPFSENDLHEDAPLGEPEELIPLLGQLKRENAIERMTIVYIPYIYNSVSDLTRIEGNQGYHWPRNWTRKRTLSRLAESEGIRYFDFMELAERERDSAGTQFAALALYVDQTHLSRLGIERLVEKLRAMNGYGTRRESIGADGSSERMPRE